jgi:hypothetical protein
MQRKLKYFLATHGLRATRTAIHEMTRDRSAVAALVVQVDCSSFVASLSGGTIEAPKGILQKHRAVNTEGQIMLPRKVPADAVEHPPFFSRVHYVCKRRNL